MHKVLLESQAINLIQKFHVVIENTYVLFLVVFRCRRNAGPQNAQAVVKLFCYVGSLGIGVLLALALADLV
jgi:hypothetical protein